MRYFHHIWVTVYKKPEDDDLVLTTLKFLFPFQIDNILEQKTAIGFEEKKIIVYKVHLQKSGNINKFIGSILERLTIDQKNLIKKQLGSRLDLKNNFYLRLEKDKLQENIFHITDDGNCYHMKMSVAAFPSTREKALGLLERLFSTNS